MNLFFAPAFSANNTILDGEESQHAVKVLRLKRGEKLWVTNGKGGMYECEMVEPSPKQCLLRILTSNEEYEKLPYKLTMAVAPTKNIDRYEWFLEKATEIGISEVVPLECDHSERRIIKLERETKVVTAAVKQSLKAYHPGVEDVVKFRKFITRDFGEAQKFIAHCDNPVEGKVYLPKVLKAKKDVVILIGPEGDFSTEEIKLAVENGFKEITLGYQRFRTETAAVVAVDIVSVLNSMTE